INVKSGLQVTHCAIWKLSLVCVDEKASRLLVCPIGQGNPAAQCQFVSLATVEYRGIRVEGDLAVLFGVNGVEVIDLDAVKWIGSFDTPCNFIHCPLSFHACLRCLHLLLN